MNTDEKFDIIMRDISEIKITQAEQHVVLKEHIRRTNLLEEDVRSVKKYVYMFLGGLTLLATVFEIFGGVWTRH